MNWMMWKNGSLMNGSSMNWTMLMNCSLKNNTVMNCRWKVYQCSIN
jgi:hypothetical protein